ncbi:O-acyltransferase like protein-like [Aedes albopictus]|uniref:Acyltransferase 3 domain-containing protein n=1 Tax=Aedes albopictus TaxID=7160 RepID=A0ABM1Z154_AEDAL
MFPRYIVVALIAVGVKIFATGSFSKEVKQPNVPWKTLPQLYDYDDFDECRRRNPNFRYSVVRAQIVENSSSLQWQQIKEYSENPRHYQRDTLEIGICLDRCPLVYSVETSAEQQAKPCAANRVWTNYQLNTSIDTWISISADDFNQPNGALETVFSFLVVLLLVLIVTCTIVDSESLTISRNNEKDHGICGFRKAEFLPIIQAFSLLENLKKLGSLNSRSRKDLLFLDGARVTTMLIILLCHASIPMIRIPLKNPERMEQQFESFWFPIAMAGNTYLVQMFFVIGGVVLSVNFMDHIKSNPQFKLWYLMDRIVNRFVRILPVYAFVILFQVSWYPRLKDGPMADRYEDHCKENWWTNLLFVNNYINTRDPCLQFTWYLGADFQLFLVGTMILMLIWRFPRIITGLFYFMVVFAVLVPAAVIYYYNLDATVMMIVRHVIAEIRNLEYYLKVYVTFESNAGNYFFGMITGIVYHKFIATGRSLESVKHFYKMFLSVALFFISMNGMTVFLPRDHLPERSLLLAIYGSLLKTSWGLLACFLIFYLTFHPGNLVASFLQHPIMLVASKLTYCAYVVQYTVVYAIYRNVTSPLMSSTFNTILFTSAVLFVTLLMGFLLHVCIEQPFMTLCKPLLAPKRTNSPVTPTKEPPIAQRGKD